MRRALPVLLVVLAACGASSFSIPEPDPLPSLPSTTKATDFSGVALAGVPGTTTSTIVLGPGGATLKGVVSGPEGVVPGATVRVERLVGDSVAHADVYAAPDGTWAAPGVLGGRFRVRAWRVPDLALTEPAVLFLGATEEKVVDLRLVAYTGVTASASVAPTPPVVEEPVTLVVRVAQQSVESDGVVRAAPIAGQQVKLVGAGDWRVDTPNPTYTDFNGDARWFLRCRSTGQQELLALIGDAGPAVQLDIPACELPVVEEPPDGTTTSTVRRRVTTTTTR